MSVWRVNPYFNFDCLGSKLEMCRKEKKRKMRILVYKILLKLFFVCSLESEEEKFIWFERNEQVLELSCFNLKLKILFKKINNASLFFVNFVFVKCE
jgi:hypothetical protein